MRSSIKENSNKGYKHPLNLDFHQVWLKHNNPENARRKDREENLCQLIKIQMCLNDWQTIDSMPGDHKAFREGK